MKQLKKGLLAFLCVMMMGALTACGSGSEDNGAVQDDHTVKEDIVDDNTMNDATEGTREEGLADEIGDDVMDGAEDVKDDIQDGVQDMEEKDSTER